MTVIPDKHTFTIWQGATFFEVLTLYETLDTSTPRDFFNETSISGLNITTNGTTAATLSAVNGLDPDTKYYVASNYIDSTKGIFFTTANPVTTNITLSSNTGVTTGTAPASIKRRIVAYSAEMIIRDKPQGTQRLKLTTAGGSPSTGCSITFSDSPIIKGRIELQITADATKDITWKAGVYDLTITNTSTNVTDALLYGGIKVNGV